MIEHEELHSILPHRNKMLLLSRIIDYNLEGRTVEAEYDATENCLFYDAAAKGIPAWVGFEFIAQAISALSGIADKARGIPPKFGFILAVSQLQMTLPFFEAGSIITIRIKETENMYPVYVFEGEIFLEGKKVLEGRVTVLELDKETEKRLLLK